jgi:hypothetical protein
MKVVISVELIGKKDNAKVFKTVDLSSIPVNNSVISFPSGPNKRLRNDIDKDIKGFKFRVDPWNVVVNAEKDICFIGTIDDSSEKNLKELVKEYIDCGWRIYE